MSLRIFFTLLLFCLLPLFEWWILLPIALIGLIVFPHYWEVLFIFLLYDLAFGIPSGWFQTQFTFTVIFAICYLLVEGTRDSFNFSQS